MLISSNRGKGQGGRKNASAVNFGALLPCPAGLCCVIGYKFFPPTSEGEKRPARVVLVASLPEAAAVTAMLARRMPPDSDYLSLRARNSYDIKIHPKIF
jgi:hypothetical protein